ncbi:helix-turn-helix domain-containing protein [Streptomyces alboflavus]|uniref:helix-turn-helix domain-containing protein n=1 Tax=Streptomyces alboflavus TaxID=67267 RepID=UPI003698DD4E
MPRVRDVDPSEGLEQYIGNFIREARQVKEWSQSQLAERLFVGQSRISEMELGDVPPDRDLAEKIERTLELSTGTLTSLVRILVRAAVRDYAQPFLIRQEQARMIHDFRLTVPPLFQTREYARALLVAGGTDPRRIDTYVEHRLDRQRLLEQEEPPWLSMILDEAALLRGTGSAETMSAQLTVLLQAQEMNHVSLRVLPLESSLSIAGSFTLITLPNGARGAYTEGFLTGNYTEEVAEVMAYAQVYDRLAASALTAEASTDRIEQALKRFT